MKKSPACEALFDLIKDEQFGIGEYQEFVSKYEKFDNVSALNALAEIRKHIIKEEAAHGLKLINMIPIFCKEEELDFFDRESIKEMKDYFLSEG